MLYLKNDDDKSLRFVLVLWLVFVRFTVCAAEGEINSKLRSSFDLPPELVWLPDYVDNERTATQHQFTQYESGITFTRHVIRLPEGASFVMNVDSDHCLGRDKYGDNNCHFAWSEILGVTVDANAANFEIQADDYLLGEIKIDSVIPYKFRCQLCGEDCILEIPVINRDIVIPMPKECGFAAISLYFIQRLENHSPVPVEVKLSGKLFVIQGSTETSVAEATIEIVVK